MASGATVKLGVEGISQFKNNMNQAKQAVKTLDAQLSLSEKQFKQTGDSESYMAEKTELLKAKLEQQKAVVDNAQKALDDMASRGVDRASKSYQDMYRQMITAKGALIDTENQLNGVAEAGDKVSDGVSEMNAQLKRVGDGVNFQQVTTGIGNITGGLEKAAKKAVNLGRKIFDAMMGAGSYADDLKTRASQYGLSTEELQRMDKTANLIDTSVEAILNAQKKLKKGIGSADKGVMGAYAELLGEGYDPKKAGWENAFWDAGEALMKFADEEEKEVYAQKLFGRSWNELLPLFEAGRKEYEETNASWKVLSEEQIDSLGKMDDEYQKLKENVEQLKMSMLAEFAEPMASLLTTINEKVNEFSEWLQSDDGRAVVDSVVGKVKEAIEWISDPKNIQTAIDALKAILTGWGILKLTGGALQTLNLVNGVKGLLGKGAGASGTSAAATGTAAAAGAKASAGAGIAGARAASAAASVANAAQIAGPVAAAAIDRFMNETNAGRALRDGGGLAGMWEGLKQDVNEKAEEVQHNAETFEDDWKNNVIVKKAKQIGRYNRIAAENTYGDDLTAEEAMALVTPKARPNAQEQGYSGTLAEFERLAKATEDLTGEGTREVKTAGEDMQDAAKKLPAEVAQAIRDQMNGMVVQMDGESVGTVLLPYLDYRMAQYILNK